ncbi:MAG: branched-chain amino acid ABC transporter permease [Deltaproteobacteria bacterium]|nr:branched-chain amino acid ABC transporter permease [Deltaproteobacteria bacterium]
MSFLAMFSIQFVHGIVYGMLLFLVAAGLTLVLGMMNVLNLAHGAFYMLGAYITYALIKGGVGFWPALVIAPIVVGLLGLLIEKFLMTRAHRLGHFHELLLTFGLFYILMEITRWIWGNVPQSVNAPQFLSGSVNLLVGGMYPVYRIFVFFVAIIILIGLVITMNKTRIGILIRASVLDSEMVNLLGINVPMLFLFVFGAGAALAGLAGVIAVPFLCAYPGMGNDILMDCFAVIVIGGFGSIYGALVAALMIGLVQSFGILLIPQFTLVLVFALMAAVFIVKPTGLFGASE